MRWETLAQQVWLCEPETEPDRTALKTRTVWVNERGRSRHKSKLSLCVLIKLSTIAEPEVGLKSNGLNKHYYLNRSPPLQFTTGQILGPGSDSPYETITSTTKNYWLTQCDTNPEKKAACEWVNVTPAQSPTKNNSVLLWADNIWTPVTFPWRSKSPDSRHSWNYSVLIMLLTARL